MSYRKRGNSTFVFGLFLCIPAVFWIGCVVYNNIVFDIHCGGHIKRAADANTVKMAEDELNIAIKYLDENHITSGYTAVIYNTPDTDVGFWYNNLKSSREELGKVTEETSQLERTNVLMKLRETLLDGNHVTMPNGIGAFPHNALYFWSGWIVLIMGIYGLIKTTE